MRVSARPVFRMTMDGSGENKYDAEPEQYYPDTPEQQGGMEESLLEHMQHDARLGSGVPPEHRGPALDSIMMSGLTTPDAAEDTATVYPASEETNPSVPVSFYEKGVDDVDSARGPVALEDTHHADADLIIQPPTIVMPDSTTANSFRDMIAEFSVETETDESVEPEIDTPQTADAEDTYAEDVLEAIPEQKEDPSDFAPDLSDAYPDEQVAPTELEEAEVVEEMAETIPIEEDVADSIELPEQDQGINDVDEIPEAEPIPAITESYAPDNVEEPLVEIAPPFPHTNEGPPRDEVIAEPVPGTVASIADLSPTVRTSPEAPVLAEAESLLRRLEEQQRAVTPPESPPAPSLLQDWTFPERAEEDIVKDEETESSGRRRSSGQRNARRRLIRWIVRAAVIAILATGGYQGYRMYLVAMATDAELYNRANAKLGSGAFLEASVLFVSLPERYAGSPLSVDAQFMAAYALTRVPDISSDAPQAYADAVLRLQQFIGDNPDHPKRYRAETLLGVMYYRTQNFEQAIAVLRNPQLQKFDRGAYLPGLRVLARAYAAVNDVERAHTTYLRAASLDENRSPDQDYLELAAMYEQRAQHTSTTELQRRYLRAAVDQWDVALRVPGLLKTRRKEIRQRRDFVADELGGGLIMEDGTRVPTSFEQSQATGVSAKDRHRQTEQQLLYVD